MQKITFWTCLYIALLMSLKMSSQVYQPLQVQSGFTEDVIAEASPASSTTTKPIDTEASGGNFAFMTAAYPGATNGLPANGLISSAVTSTSGLNFQLAPYDGSNSLRLNANGGQGTLLFQNLVKAKKVFVLATSGSAISTFTGVITFNDNTTQNITSQSVPDWYGGSNYAIRGIGRVSRTTSSTVENNSTDPRIYQVAITIDAANQTKQIKSIQFTKTSPVAGFLNIFGVTAEIAEDCPSPETTTFSNINTTGATATWTAPPLIPALGYLYELRTNGPAGSGSTGLVLSETVTTLSKTFTLLQPSTTYSFYIKSVCSGTESSGWRLGGTFTTATPGHIGSGTATSGNLPIVSNWGYTYSQQIYTKTQIDAAVANGNTFITKIRFYYNGTSNTATAGSLTSTTTFNNWTVYLGNTAKASFTSNTDWVPLTALQQTFSGTVTFPAPGNWMEITFDTPFIWNGTDNLVVAVKENVTDYGSLVYWRSFTSGDNTGIYYRNDDNNPSPSNPPTASGRVSNINQIQLHAIVPTICSGTPNAGVVTPATPQVLCSGQDPNPLSVQNVNNTINILYQWQESDDNGATDAWADAVGGTGATTLTYTPPTFTGTNKYYRLKTTCTASNEVAFSTVAIVQSYASPTNAATNLVFSSVTDFSMKIDWTNGNGGRRMVVISNTNNFTPTVDGENAAITANVTYSGSGQQIVYDGTGTTVTVNGLNCSTTYYVHVYEYNRCGSAAPYTYWYALPLSGSEITTVSSLGTTATNLGLTANFNTFNANGDNLPTASPGWNERKGDGPFTANTSGWKGGTSLNGTRTARVNLYATSVKDWMISPLVTLDVLARIKFKAAITTYNATTAYANGMQGTDDKVEVMISTDACGTVWTPLYTFNAANTATLTNVLADFEVLIPEQYVGQNVRIGFKASDGPLDDSNDYDFHIANVSIEVAPTCADTNNVTSSNITKNTATISWNASAPAPANGYEYEIRTEGTPGSAGAVQTDTTAVGIITKDVTGLTPATTYNVYVRSVCDGATKGNWSLVHTFTTLCNYPDIINSTGDTICGLGTAELSVNISSGIAQWFSEATGGTLLHTGTTFTTPEISTNTTYYVQTAASQPNIVTQVGNGTAASSAAAQSPLYYSFGGYKHQYIYTAQELLAAGLSAGEINSVGFNVVTGSTANRNDFTIHIGTTTQNTATTTHVSGLTQVYSNAAQPMTVGINTYPFTSPFVWDGTSNIVVQVNWSNNNGGESSKSGSIRYHSTPNNQCTYTQVDNKTAAQILQTMSGVVAGGNGGTNVSKFRANTYFNGFGLCSSPRTAVIATVTPAPELVLSTLTTTICEDASTTITITSGANNYDTYSWTPTTGVTGNATTGFVFNPEESTTYTLLASQSTGTMCSTEKTVVITVKAKPEFTSLPLEQTICANEIQTLSSGIIPLNIEFMSESFGNTTNLPANWNSEGGSITIGNSNNAGGTANEIVITGDSFSNVTRRIFYGPIDTNNLSEVTLHWKNYLNHYSSSYNYSVKVQTSTNGTTWNNTTWGANPVTSSQQASDQSVTINSSDVGSSTFYIAFTIQGADFGMHTWHIDNVRLTAPEQYDFEWTPVTNLYTDATATIPYTTASNAETVYFKSATAMLSTPYSVSITNSANCFTTNTTAITVNETPAPVVTETTYCKNSTLADITTSIQTTNTIKWYNAATAGNLLPPTTELVDGTTYYASQIENGCESIVRTAVTVVVHNTAAPTTTATIQEFCIQDNATLEDLIIEGTDIKWYSTSVNGTELSNETLLVNDTTYYASQTLNDCESLTRLAIKVNVFATAAPTTNAVSQLFCPLSNSTLADVAITGDEIKWYDAATGGNELSSTTLLTNDTTYYASQTRNNCESVNRLAIDVVVDNIMPPSTPNANQLFCIQSNSTLEDVEITGTDIKWYDAETEGQILNETTPLVDGTTYYATQTITGCESDNRLAITVQVQDTSAPTIANENLFFCIQEEATLDNITVNGTNVKWYASETSIDELPFTTLLQTGTYFARQTVNDCESTASLMINVTVTNTETLTTAATTQGFCIQNTPTISDLSVNGTNVKWYDSVTGGNELLTTTALIHNQTYYAVQISNNCESSVRLAVTAQVFNTLAPTATNTTQTFCSFNTPKLSNITVNGTNIKWYATQTGGNALDNNTSLTNGTTYYASQTANGCESTSRLAINVIVGTNPIITTTSFVACPGTILSDVTIDGLTFNQLKWYASASSNTTLPANNVLNNGTYYVSTFTVGICESVKKPIQVTINHVPQPTASSQSICGNGIVADLVALPALNATISWYSSAQSTTPLSLTTPLQTGTYYVDQTINGCKSTKKPVSVSVVNTAAPNVDPFTLCQGSTVQDLVLPTGGGVAYLWYANASSNTPLQLTQVLTSGVYFVERSSLGCVSERKMVNVNILPTPQSPTGNTTQVFQDSAFVSDLIANEPNVIWYNSLFDAQNGTNALQPEDALVNGHIYYGVLTSVAGCRSLPLEVTVQITVGIRDLDLVHLKYYPNPVLSELNISYIDNIKTVEVFTVLGQKVMSKSFSSRDVKINLSNLSSGTYVIRIVTDNASQFVKIIKQ